MGCFVASRVTVACLRIIIVYIASEAPPSFCGLPKIHKADVPLRLIMSSVGTVVHNIAKFLVPILGPLAGKPTHHVKDSKEFAWKVR